MSNETVYAHARGEDNIAYVCPLDKIEEDGQVRDDQLDDCIEADVVGRYSGMIKMADR